MDPSVEVKRQTESDPGAGEDHHVPFMSLTGSLRSRTAVRYRSS